MARDIDSSNLSVSPTRGPLLGGRRLLGPPRTQPPLVSIVVVVFRAYKKLCPLLESILQNKTDETEVVVIDGASNDGTVDILQRLGPELDFWSSEPDEGIYDAMNKGIKASTGHFILHLNSGDRLIEIPSSRLRQCIANRTTVACFSVLMDGTYIFRPKNGFIMKLDNAWHHQGTFYQRRSHPGYDLRYRVFSDFDLNQRLMLNGARVGLFDDIVAEHHTDGVSSTNIHRHEVYQIIRSNFGLPYLFLACIRFSLNSVRRHFKAL